MKKLLFFLFIILIFSSCVTQKKCNSKFPPQTIKERYDSIVYKDTVIYKDREVEVKIPGETVYRDSLIPGIPEKINTKPITLENKYATAKAWIENSKLRLRLDQKDQVITFKLDSADKLVKHWQAEYHKERDKETVTIKVVPKFYKITAISLFVILLLIGVYIYVKIKT